MAKLVTLSEADWERLFNELAWLRRQVTRQRNQAGPAPRDRDDVQDFARVIDVGEEFDPDYSIHDAKIQSLVLDAGVNPLEPGIRFEDDQECKVINLSKFDPERNLIVARHIGQLEKYPLFGFSGDLRLTSGKMYERIEVGETRLMTVHSWETLAPVDPQVNMDVFMHPISGLPPIEIGKWVFAYDVGVRQVIVAAECP